MSAEQKQSSAELTSTLHLGVRQTVDGQANSAIDALLAASSDDERAIYESLLNGSTPGSMVVINRGPARGARFLLDQGECTIGRASDTQIFLDDVTVSRHHATISSNADVVTFKDSGSLNGSYINNEAVTEKVLAVGDEIQIGKFHLLFIGQTK